MGHGPHSLAHLRDADAFFGLPVRGSITVVCLDPDATNAEDGTSPPSKAAYESLCSASGLSPSSQYWSGRGRSGWLGITLMQAWLRETTPDWPQRLAEQGDLATALQVRLQCMLHAFTRVRGRGR